MDSIMLATADDFRRCWGKAQPLPGTAVSWHPIAHHSLDVAAVAGALLSVRPLALRRAAQLLRLCEEDTRTLLVAFIALHDIGKFAPAFQKKSPEHWPVSLYGSFDESWVVNGHHTTDGFVLWSDDLASWAIPRLWTGGDILLNSIAPAVFGHHGRPTGGVDRTTVFARFQRREAITSARACAESLLALLIPAPITSTPPNSSDARRASWWISGLVTAADWVGSSQQWFPYTAPLEGDSTLHRYWELAQDRARAAVEKAGLRPPASSPPRSMQQLIGRSFSPTPAQEWASSVELPDGPMLVILEDVTGAGKTEAAQMLVHRLMADGRSLGAYWAMPTQATANAMYGRQAWALDRFYESSGFRPSLVLSHGQQRLHAAFRATVLEDAADRTTISSSTNRVDTDDMTGTATCTAWLADDRRAALLADMGAGTIDQALLGILPSKFNTVRLFGLADKVLVIDEAHAYDTYMSEELKELLRFHSALGGNAIVLSATLPHDRRAAIVQAWQDGTLGGQRHARQSTEVESHAYPLGTVVGRSTVREDPIAAAQLCRRSVPVRLVHDIESAAEHVANAARRGGAVAWIRNTVDDCLAAATVLQDAHGIDALVFHARFAQCDRQEREREVLARFGKQSSPATGRARVLVATQVIEQSLDLDFDAMMSDVAPIDLLVQRAGRLWRHERSLARPRELACELIVLSPTPEADPPKGWLSGVFAGTAHVYPRLDVLWRTVRVLDRVRAIETPGGLRDLIESVYGADAAPVPDSLLEQVNRAEGEESGHASLATFATLKVTDGYDASAHAWMSDIRARTRLSDDQTVVRLARVRDNGGLVPWDTSESETPWKAWALSEVRVSAIKVPWDATAEPQYDSAVAAAREKWGRFEQEIPVLPLVVDGATIRGTQISRKDGKRINVTYSADRGLAYDASDR